MITFTNDRELMENKNIALLKLFELVKKEDLFKLDLMSTLNTIAIQYPNEVFNYVFCGFPFSVEIADIIALNSDIQLDYNNSTYKELF